VEVVIEQTIAEQLEWFPLFQFGQCLQKCNEVATLAEHLLTIVATIDHVVDQASIDRT
jgi:hypothetical protein